MKGAEIPELLGWQILVAALGLIALISMNTVVTLFSWWRSSAAQLFAWQLSAVSLVWAQLQGPMISLAKSKASTGNQT